MAGPDHQVLPASNLHVDGVVQTIRLERLRAIQHVVLMTQLVRDVFEGLCQILRLEGKECLPAGLVREILQNLVAVRSRYRTGWSKSGRGPGRAGTGECGWDTQRGLPGDKLRQFGGPRDVRSGGTTSCTSPIRTASAAPKSSAARRNRTSRCPSRAARGRGRWPRRTARSRG